MAVSRGVKRSIEKRQQYHAILEVLRVAYEEGYNSREVPSIFASVGAQFTTADQRGVLSHTDVGTLVRFLMGDQTYHHIGDNLTNLTNAGYSKHFWLPASLSKELEALTSASGHRKAYYSITPSGIEFSTSFPVDPSRFQSALAVYFGPMLAPAENHKV